MRKWRFTQPVLSSRTAVFLAVAGTLAAHALFLLPAYRTVQRENSSSTSGVQILNMSNLSGKQQQDLQNWIALHDPARSFKSSSRSGYTALLVQDRKITIPVTPYQEKHSDTIPAVKGFTALPVAGSPARLAPEEDVRPLETQIVRKATVMDHKGKVVMEIVSGLPAGAGSNMPTVIQIRKTGKVSIVEILSGSGNPVLDHIATARAARWRSGEDTVLTFIWPQEGGK